jgi:hypothetical protein
METPKTVRTMRTRTGVLWFFVLAAAVYFDPYGWSALLILGGLFVYWIGFQMGQPAYRRVPFDAAASDRTRPLKEWPVPTAGNVPRVGPTWVMFTASVRSDQ